MIEFKKLFEHRNRGLLLDATIFLFQLILIRLLTTLSLGFVRQAEENVLAKTAISLFLVGLFVLQPLGPILKRWSFHQHFKSFDNDESGLTSFLLSVYKFFYIAAMWIIIYVAYSYFIVVFPDSHSARNEKIVVAAAIVLPVLSGFVIFRYFRRPKALPRWKFLMTPQAEVLGDLCMFLNVICFQILFSVYVSSPHFWNALHKITRLESGNVSNSLSGRLYIACLAALLAYFPPRIFYLVIDQHRKITWLMMLLANLPLILAIVFYAPSPQSLKALREPSFTLTAAGLHDEYEANYQAGMRKYLGKYVNVTGRVQTRFFPRSLELEDQIGLDGKEGFPWVYCSFDEDQVETAEALEMGQVVTFQCVGSDNWSHGPALKHCVLVTSR
ncbi:MAG: OB-fold protein [Pyrinomonadaceae bacterium]